MAPQNSKKKVLARRKVDRRVARTQKLLRDALHSLIHEKDYDSIAVKEILDRANVGRSAFYMHFRDKDELLASTLHETLALVPSPCPVSGDENREILLRFSRPIFEHLHKVRRVGTLKLGPKGRAVLHGHLEKVLAAMIEEDIRKMFRSRGKPGSRIPLDLLVRYIDSTFILVLNWWVENKSPLTPKAVDELFCSMVKPTLMLLQTDNQSS